MSRIAFTGTVRQREPRVRDKAHLGRVAALPCLACAMGGWLRRGVHVAHVRAQYPEPGWREVGKSEKPSDFRTVPLCPAHHMDGPDAQHRHNERSWYETLGVYPPAFCAALVLAFEHGESGDNVVRQAAAGAFRLAPMEEPGVD